MTGVLREVLCRSASELSSHISELLEISAVDRVSSEKSRLLAPVITLLKEKEAQLAQLADDLGSPFLLFIVGMGKFGKSTLLNALAGSRLAAMDVLPKTWKIDIYEAAEPGAHVTIRFRDGSSGSYTVEEASIFLAEEERKREQSEHLIFQKFREESAKLPDSSAEAREELQRYLKEKYLYISPVSEVHWPCQRRGLLTSFRLVDTPGLWQDYLPDDMRASLSDYYHKADGVIWVLDAQKISARKPRELMEGLQKALDRIGKRTGNVVAVLNRIDTVASADSRSVERVVEEAYRLFGDLFSEIVPVSALQALKAIETGDDELLSQSGLKRLLDVIERHFKRNAARLQRESKLTGATQILRDVKIVVAEYKNRLDADDSQRLALKAEFEEDLKRMEKSLADMVISAIAMYRDAARARIEVLAEQLIDAPSNEEKKRILAEIVGGNELNAIMNNCLTRAKQIISEFSAFWVSRSAMSEFKYLPSTYTADLRPVSASPVLDANAFSFDISSEVFGLGTLISLLGGVLLGPVGFVAGAVASMLGVSRTFVKLMRLPGTKEKLYSELQRITYEAQNALMEALRKSVTEISNCVSQTRESSFASLHCVTENLPALRQCLESIKSQELPKLEPISISIRGVILEGRKEYAVAGS